MKKFYILFLIGFTLSFLEAKIIIKHTVQRGDTLSTIAQKYRTSTGDIRKRNTLGNKKLGLNQVLTVAMNTHVTKKKVHLTQIKKKIQKPKVKVATLTPVKIKKVHTLDRVRVLRAKTKQQKLKTKVVKVKPVVLAKSVARTSPHLKTSHSLESIRAIRLKKIQTVVALKKKESIVVKKKKVQMPKVKVATLTPIKIKKVHTLDAARMLRSKTKQKSLKTKVVKIKPKVLSERTRSTSVLQARASHSLESIRARRLKTKQAKMLRKSQTVLVLKKKVSKKLTGSRTYAVKSGDTLFTIARKHGMTVSTLLKLNDIKYKETLKLGQKFNISKKLYVAKAKKKTVKKKLKIARKTRTYKKKKKVLRTTLARQLLPTRTKRIKRKNRVTVDDIFFKSSKPNILIFSSNKSSNKIKNIINMAKTKLGRKYVWGAVGQRGTFDCSGFTSYVYKKNGINIPRTSLNQSKYGKYISRSNLKKGDLVFFDTSKKRKGYVNHVGIYLGNGKFIHASSAKKKVVVSSLSKFYAKRYKGARRPS